MIFIYSGERECRNLFAPGRRKFLVIIGVAALVVLYLLATARGPAVTQVVENGVATGLTPEEEAGIRNDLIAALSQKHYSFQPSPKDLCAVAFALGQPVFVDVSMQGTTGKVAFDVPVTAGSDIHRLAAAPECYGAPPSGWWPGMTAPARYNVMIEKWSSGWRMVPGQTLRAGG